MTSLAFSTFSALVAVGAAGAVVSLTPETFDSEVGDPNFDLVVVKFYASWGGHCKHMAPAYEEAASYLKISHPRIKLARIDAAEHEEFNAKYEIHGYPTLKVFRNGDLNSPTNYEGQRSASGLMAEIARLARPVITEFSTVDDMEKAAATALEQHEVVVSGAFTHDGLELDAFRAMANNLYKSFTILLVPRGAPDRSILVHTPGQVPHPFMDFEDEKPLQHATEGDSSSTHNINADANADYEQRVAALSSKITEWVYEHQAALVQIQEVRFNQH